MREERKVKHGAVAVDATVQTLQFIMNQRPTFSLETIAKPCREPGIVEYSL